MFKKYLIAICLVVLAATAVPAGVRAQSTTDTAALLALLQSLMKQVEVLQKQLAEVQSQLKSGLHEGMQDDDIKKIQELLATDPLIYPGGKVTGYYGPMTKEAIMRFQERHGLTVTGTVDEATKKLMQEYFRERKSGTFPPGLLRAPGIAKKMQDRLRERDGEQYLDCDDKKAAGPFCKDDQDTEDEDEDENEDDDDTNEVSADEAKEAIDDADDSIEELEDTIAEADDQDAIDEAEERLLLAEEELIDARGDYQDKDYDSALGNALNSLKFSERGIDELIDEMEIGTTTASRLIDEAQDAISSLDETIDDAQNDEELDENDVEVAEDALVAAKNKLDDAQDDYADNDYRDAYEKALKAKEIAKEAEDDLEDLIE